MALVPIPRTLYTSLLTGSTGNQTAIDAVGEYRGCAWAASQDMDISHMQVMAVVAAGSPTGKASIQGVDLSTQLFNGLWDTGTEANTATLVANTPQILALGATASILKGEYVGANLEFLTGTSFQISLKQQGTSSFGRHWQVFNIGTPTAASIAGVIYGWGIGPSATEFYQEYPFLPASGAIVTQSWNNSGNPLKRGVRFSFIGGRIEGFQIIHNADQKGTFDIELYTDAGVLIETGSVAAAPGININALTTFALLDSQVELLEGFYRLVMVPTSATNVNMFSIPFASAAAKAADPVVWGEYGEYTTFHDGAGWVDTPLNTPNIVPVVNAIEIPEDGGGGGGGAVFLRRR